MDDGRHETPTQRADRNYNELLQELRVSQTGVTVLIGFLLTLPFQQRFETLTGTHQKAFFVAFTLATLSSALFTTPVIVHRRLFRQKKKQILVDTADRLAQAGLITLSLALVTIMYLVVAVVFGETQGRITAGASGVVLIILWGLLPEVLRMRQVQSPQTGDSEPGPL